MTIAQVLEYIDEYHPNNVSEALKLRWINEAEGYVQREVILDRSHNLRIWYGEGDRNTTLIAPPPYDRLYIEYLDAQLFYLYHEISDYENAAERYNATLRDYAAWYARLYHPARAKGRWRRHKETEYVPELNPAPPPPPVDPGTTYYYASLYAAVADANRNFAAGSDAGEDEAKVRAYSSGGAITITLLDNLTETETILPAVSLTIVLAGCGITSSAQRFLSYDSADGIDVTIDGSAEGSSITLDSGAGMPILAYWRYTGSGSATLKAVGGEYNVNGNQSFAAAFYANAAGTVDLDGCNINVRGSGSTARSQFAGLLANGGAHGRYKNCSVDVRYSGSGDAQTAGIWNQGSDIYAQGSTVFVDAPYTPDKCVNTDGIYNSAGATMTLKACTVTGVEAGVDVHGPITVDGGTYEAVGHGGFVFNGADIVCRIKNATIREGTYRGTLTPLIIDGQENPGFNHTAFYFGWSLTGTVNPSVYMDNCTISASSNTQLIAFKRSKKCKLYISNTTVPAGKLIRIDQLLQDYDDNGNVIINPDDPDDYNLIYVGESCNIAADKIFLRTGRFLQNGQAYSNIMLAVGVSYTPTAHEILTQDAESTAEIQKHIMTTGENYGFEEE